MADFWNTMADADDGSLAAGIEVTATVFINDPATFAACGNRIGFAEISREERWILGHNDKRIVADGKMRGPPSV